MTMSSSSNTNSSNNSRVADVNDALIQELSSSRRVRSRLATSQDASLPKVLSMLLPRLLRKMDANRDDIISNSAGGGNSSGSTTQLRTSIHEELLGVVNHAIDRIEIMKNVNVLLIVQSMAVYFAEIAAAPPSDERSLITPGLTYALKILKLCLSRSSEQFYLLGNTEVQSNNFDTLISVLKASIVTIERMDSASSSNQVRDNNNQSFYADFGWLVFDSISLGVGICPLGLDLPPSDVNGDSQINEQEYTQRYTKIVATIAPLAGSATYNLFLDLILYQQNNGASCGLSPRGIGRMQALTSSAREPARYEIIDSAPISLCRWNELKLVVLKVATGTVKGGGVFGWRGEMEEEDTKGLVNEDCTGTARAIALLVLASSGRGRSKEKFAVKVVNFANTSLQAYVGKKVTAPIKKSSKGGRSQSPRSASKENDCAIVRATSILLCLALGEVEACSAIRKHEEQWNNTSVDASSTAMMIMSNTTNDSRSPLSANKAHAVLRFIMTQLQISASIEPRPYHCLGKEKEMLISLALHAAQLALRLNEANDEMRRIKRMHIGWGDGTVCASRLLLALAEWLNACIAKESLISLDLEFEMKSGFVEHTCKQIINNAYEILKSDILPLLSQDIVQGLGIEEEDQPPEDAPPIAYRHRGRLARQLRVARSRQNTLVPPLEIRKCCVDVIRKLARYSAKRDIFFDVPVLLFKCKSLIALLVLSLRSNTHNTLRSRPRDGYGTLATHCNSTGGVA